MKNELTHIVFVLDESGSMHDVRSDVIGGFNQFLEDQKKLGDDAVFTLVKFNDEYEMVYDAVPISEVLKLTEDTYSPGSLTALLDAVGKTIKHVSDKKVGKWEEAPKKVLFVVFTDGIENASKEYQKWDVILDDREERPGMGVPVHGG